MNVTEHRNSFVRVVVCDTLRVDSFAAYAYSKNATTRFFASRLGYAYGPVSDKSMLSDLHSLWCCVPKAPNVQIQIGGQFRS